MKRLLPVVLAVLIALGGAALAGNTGHPVAEPGESASPVRMRVEVTQGRVDEVRHTVQVSMNNDGTEKIIVERVELQAPSFKGVGPVQVDAPLPVGGLRVDVPISYGTGICGGDDRKPRSAAAHVAFRVRTEDGSRRARTSSASRSSSTASAAPRTPSRRSRSPTSSPPGSASTAANRSTPRSRSPTPNEPRSSRSSMPARRGTHKCDQQVLSQT